MSTLHLLSAGAARALAEALAADFLRRHDASLEAEYGAVGAMRERLAAGAPCDVIVLTAAMIEALGADGTVLADTIAPLGRVYTGVAVRAGDPQPVVGEPQDLARALDAADAIYVPDPQRATAGIHFVGVLDRLGARERLQERLRTFPNGAAAMTALAQAPERTPIGCTQVTEILYTPGVALVGPLPAQFELATVYSVAVTRAARDPALARAFASALSGPGAAGLRRAGGFEP